MQSHLFFSQPLSGALPFSRGITWAPFTPISSVCTWLLQTRVNQVLIRGDWVHFHSQQTGIFLSAVSGSMNARGRALSLFFFPDSFSKHTYSTQLLYPKKSHKFLRLSECSVPAAAEQPEPIKSRLYQVTRFICECRLNPFPPVRWWVLEGFFLAGGKESNSETC